MTSQKFFGDFSVLDTMYQWSMIKNIHSPDWVGIGSWGPEIRPHEYLISPTEISVNWPGSKKLWTRPIYTDFNGANEVFMRPYLGPPWTNSCQIWCERVFSSCSTEILSWKRWNAKNKIWWRHASVLYGVRVCGTLKPPFHAILSVPRDSCLNLFQFFKTPHFTIFLEISVLKHN